MKRQRSSVLLIGSLLAMAEAVVIYLYRDGDTLFSVSASTSRMWESGWAVPHMAGMFAGGLAGFAAWIFGSRKAALWGAFFTTLGAVFLPMNIGWWILPLVLMWIGWMTQKNPQPEENQGRERK